MPGVIGGKKSAHGREMARGSSYRYFTAVFFFEKSVPPSIGPGKESGPICSDHCSPGGQEDSNKREGILKKKRGSDELKIPETPKNLC